MTDAPKKSPKPWNRPDHEKADPKSPFYVPNDPEVRAKQRPQEKRATIHRKTRLEVDQADGGAELAKLRERHAQADAERLPPPEPTECPLCGLTEIQALATRQQPALIIRPGWVECSCRPEAFHVGAELAKLRGEQDEARRMIRECWREDAKRDHEPGNDPTGSAKDREPGRRGRAEQDWQGFAEPEQSRSDSVEKLVVVLKGKVPRLLRDRLSKQALHTRKSEGWIFRRLLEKHLRDLSSAFSVEYGSDTVMLEVMLTRQHADLWGATKAGLAEQSGRHVSNADMMAAVMLREWV